MENNAEKGRKIAERNPRIEANRRELSAGGREPHERYMFGNVRTYLWHNSLNESVPAYVEQLRYYSSPKDWNTTRLLEASDLTHSLRGLNDALDFAQKNRLLGRKPENLDPQLVKKSAMKGFNPKWRCSNSGNVALVSYYNGADKYDYVLKAAILAVSASGEARGYLLASQIPDAVKLLTRLEASLAALHEVMGEAWKGVDS